MSIQTICRVIETGSVNQALRAYRTAKRIHLNMETFNEGTRATRRSFEQRLEDALRRRIHRSHANNKQQLKEEVDNVCLAYLS
jgi:hypothetical protein